VTGLGEAYATLPKPPSQDGGHGRIFSVAPIEGFLGYFIARSDSDQPALIIEVAGRPRAPIVLQNLAVRFNAPCVLDLATERRSTNAAVVECLASDERLRQFFLAIAGHLLEELGFHPAPEEVAAAVDALVSLFQRLSRPPRREAQGLFGELVIIDAAHDPTALLDAWHGDPLDRFDFAFDNARLEVKTNSGRRRSHDFSLEQCNPPPATTATLASLFVESSGGGLSLERLIFRVEARLAHNPSSIVKLYTVIADTLGAALPSALAQRFDEQLAFGSIAFYDLTTIPAVRGQLPMEVTAVRFRSDISSLAPLSPIEVAELLPAFATPPPS
jgi:hypothetical protein